MFSDTLTVTVNAVAKTLVRINQDSYSSEYALRETTGAYSLKIKHTTFFAKARGKTVERHSVELTQTVYPAVSGGVNTIRKAYSVFEFDQGDIVADELNFSLGFAGFETSPNLTRLINFES